MCLGMGYLPVVLVLLSFGTIVLTYIIAIVNDHVSAYFPYISDTGTKIPESCIFGQFLNMAAALALGTMYVRYKLVAALGGAEDTKLRRLNKVGLVLGILSSLGLSMVANFQETSVEPVHIVGAGLVFGLGVVYTFVQVGLSYHMCPDFNGIYVCRVRLTLALVSLFAMISTVVAASISRYQKWTSTDRFHWEPGDASYSVSLLIAQEGISERQTTLEAKQPSYVSVAISRINGHPKDRLHWKPSDGGFDAHIVSTFSEWAMAVFFLLFFFTYVRDFQKMRLEVKPRLHVRHLDEEPIYADESTRLLG